ncbi:MAG: hypothetical protein J0M18_00470 [Ignavibacteria bacterium]|jgi:hypothetical protein|nr:hypothetical protein [Ignavibacteria bacterium]
MSTKKSHLESSTEMGFINLKGYYSGVPIYKLEYEPLKKIILLSNIRSLFLIKLPDIVYITETRQGIKFDILKDQCPDVYKNIFEKENNIYNIELIIKFYPTYYEFIENFVVNEISVEHFKEKYTEIIQLMNSSITQLISARVKIEHRKNNNSSSSYEINSINFNRPEPITWEKSKESLLKLFQYLANENYIEPISEENLLSHFIISQEKKSFDFENNKSKPIVWLAKKTSLCYFLEYISSREFVKYHLDNVNVAGEKHFMSKDGIFFKNIGQSKHNTKQTKNPEVLHSKLISLINSSQH